MAIITSHLTRGRHRFYELSSAGEPQLATLRRELKQSKIPASETHPITGIMMIPTTCLNDNSGGVKYSREIAAASV